eukprot:58990-Pleurochrysis_carterae.AAC.1
MAARADRLAPVRECAHAPHARATAHRTNVCASTRTRLPAREDARACAYAFTCVHAGACSRYTWTCSRYTWTCSRYTWTCSRYTWTCSRYTWT